MRIENLVNEIRADLAAIAKLEVAVGQKINDLMADLAKQNGWTMRDLAARLDVSESYISQVKAGKKKISPHCREGLFDLSTMIPCPQCETYMVKGDYCSHCGYKEVISSEEMDGENHQEKFDRFLAKINSVSVCRGG